VWPIRTRVPRPLQRAAIGYWPLILIQELQAGGKSYVPFSECLGKAFIWLMRLCPADGD
jgi:hypothetical protein